MNKTSFKTRIHLCHHGLAFSNSLLSFVWLKASPSPSQDFLRDLVIPFSCYLSLRLFYYVLYVLIFYSIIVLLLWHQVVGLSSCILHQLVSSIFFRHFGSSCFVYIARSCPCIFWFSLLSPISFDSSLSVVLSKLPAVFFWFFIQIYPRAFSFLITFACCHCFFICPFSQISYPGFVFLFGFR